MLNTKEENIKFLDSLFTQKDFYFLNSLDNEISLIQCQIEKQEKKRDIIVDAINSFEPSIKNLSKNNISPVSNLLEEVENSFVLVNSNIKSLYELKEFLTDINTKIINLLISIESHPSSVQTYIKQVDKLKEVISNYSINCSDIKSTIANNDLTLNEFLNSQRFKNISKNIEIESSNIKTNMNSESEKAQIQKNEDLSHLDSVEDYYNSKILRISEKENKVYLPYTNNEIKSYLTHFPEDYNSPEDVISKEFVLSLDYYIKHPVLSRFRETYSLIRDREGKSILEAIKYSMNLMFTYELSPTIVAACKTQEQLENYLDCLEKNQLDDFKDFEIKFEINPL